MKQIIKNIGKSTYKKHEVAVMNRGETIEVVKSIQGL